MSDDNERRASKRSKRVEITPKHDGVRATSRSRAMPRQRRRAASPEAPPSTGSSVGKSLLVAGDSKERKTRASNTNIAVRRRTISDEQKKLSNPAARETAR